MKTLLLRQQDVVRHLDALAVLAALREGFREHSATDAPAAWGARAEVAKDASASVLFPGLSPSVPAYSVKVQARFANAAQLATSFLHLHDRATGELLAVMEASQLTSLGTGLTAALAADVLARPEASTVALLGASRQASVALKCLRLVRSLRSVRIWDRDPAAADALARRTWQTLSLPSQTALNVEEAVAEADLVLCVDDGGEPLLYPGMLRSGAHVCSLPAGEPGKADLSANLIRQSKFFCDDRALAQSQGILGALGLGGDLVAAELGEVLRGTREGRIHGDEITLFAAVGLPLTDLSAAWSVYESAKEDETIARIDFGEAVTL
ncbi:MAG: ornithine cyclodeaminase family protein [Myxococcaceae bacterium]|nr:ornithine cyclodeaminase family protein [Myxococcaceae bacterium]